MSNNLTQLVALFDGSDYQAWWPQMQAFLMSQEIWDIVTGEEILPKKPSLTATEDDKATYKEANRKNQKALGILRLRVAANLHHMFTSQYKDDPADDDEDWKSRPSTAREVWEQIKAEFGKPGSSMLFADFKRAMTIRLPANRNPIKEINEMRTLFLRLNEHDVDIPSSIRAMILLNALPRGWDTVPAIVLQGTTPDSLDFVTAKDAIIAEYERRKVIGPSNGESAQRLSNIRRRGGNPNYNQQRGRPHQNNGQQQRGNPQQQRGQGQNQQGGRQGGNGRGRGRRGGQRIRERRESAQNTQQSNHDGHNVTLANPSYPSLADCISHPGHMAILQPSVPAPNIATPVLTGFDGGNQTTYQVFQNPPSAYQGRTRDPRRRPEPDSLSKALDLSREMGLASTTETLKILETVTRNQPLTNGDTPIPPGFKVAFATDKNSETGADEVSSYIITEWEGHKDILFCNTVDKFDPVTRLRVLARLYTMGLANDTHPGFNEFLVNQVDRGDDIMSPHNYLSHDESNQSGFDNGYESHTRDEELFGPEPDDDDDRVSLGSYGGEDYIVNGGDDEMFDGYVTPSLTQSHSANQPTSQILNVEDG